LPLARIGGCVTLSWFEVRWSSSMSIESHLNELVRRHQAIEEAILSEESHPGSDDVKIHELKIKKLYLKDQIEKLKHETEATAAN
jgi:hypothetical protein